jgi:type I restriction enzyme S subunit
MVEAMTSRQTPVVFPGPAKAGKNLEIFDEFKETEIGPIPVDWELLRLREIAKVKYGKAKPKTDGMVPVVGSGGPYGWTDSPLVDFPTLVVGRKGTAGRVWLMEQPCWPSDTTFYLEWKRPVDITFLFGYLTLNPLSGEHAKTTLPSLQRPDLENYSLPLPPLPEQRRIAHVLNTIQREIAAQDALIAAAREVKRSLMGRLFTYGPGVEPAPTKETEIGEMPEHWEVVRLSDVVEIVAGGTPSRKKPEYWGGGIPWVKTGEVKYNIITHTEENITQEGLDNSSARLIPAGTLLMAMYGQGVTRGKVAILGIDAAVNQACAAMFVTEAVTTDFLFHFFSFSYERIRNLGHGAHQKNLSATLLNSVQITLPPISEQRGIAHFLAAIDHKIAAEEERKAALQALFKSMLHQLMTGQLRLMQDFETQRRKDAEAQGDP